MAKYDDFAFGIEIALLRQFIYGILRNLFERLEVTPYF